VRIRSKDGDTLDLAKMRNLLLIDPERYKPELMMLDALEAALNEECPKQEILPESATEAMREREWGFIEGSHRQQRAIRHAAGVIE
jgi:hypothetical protein